MKFNEHLNDVRRFCLAVGQSAPNTPTEPTKAEKELRVRLILEEALETARAFGVTVSSMVPQGEELTSTDDLHIVANGVYDVVGVADGAADLWYVGPAGISTLCGFALEPIIIEVSRSNMSKINQGYRRDDGKWVKGPNYSPAYLEDKICDHDAL